jgi:hypothetical protein
MVFLTQLAEGGVQMSPPNFTLFTYSSQVAPPLHFLASKTSEIMLPVTCPYNYLTVAVQNSLVTKSCCKKLINILPFYQRPNFLAGGADCSVFPRSNNNFVKSLLLQIVSARLTSYLGITFIKTKALLDTHSYFPYHCHY